MRNQRVGCARDECGELSVGAEMLEAEKKATSRGGIVSTATRLAAMAAIIFFLATAFRSGWRRAETDFPNYYTAAVLMHKRMPVREYYDWTWFQRQMNFVGVERQLGGYQPQTPLTALPLIGLANFPVQTAKQIWLVANFASWAPRFGCWRRLQDFDWSK